MWHIHRVDDPMSVLEVMSWPERGVSNVGDIQTSTAPETKGNASPEADQAAAERILGERGFRVKGARTVDGKKVIVATMKSGAAVSEESPDTSPRVRLHPPERPYTTDAAPGSGCVLIAIVAVLWVIGEIACIFGCLHGL